MQIDWLTVTAQVANFLILIFLLHRFLYGPIVRAMDRREQTIGARFEEVRQLAEAAEEEGRGYRDMQRQFDERKDGFLAEARAEADALRKRLSEEARREIEAQRIEWLEQLRRERRNFLQDAKMLTADQLVTVARRALADLAHIDLEEHIVGVFIERLRSLNSKTRQQLAEDCHEAGDTLLVMSRFELPGALRAQITRALHEAILPDAKVEYELNAEMVCGLQLAAGGHVVAWNMSGYLDGLGEALSGILRERPASDERTADAVAG